MSYVDLLPRLSLEEKIHLTSGQDFWRTRSYPHHSLPYAKVTDGPSGARGGGDFNDSIPAALFPSPCCLASTFDVNLATLMGQGIALDSRSKQCHVVLAPTINITRDQRYGRAFENYGEDPLLSGKVGAAWVIGCQSVGVGATPKHYILNEAEEDRRYSDSKAGEEAMREVYLEAFRVLLKEVARAHEEGTDGEKGRPFQGQPACIMTAYNRVNGVSASENKLTLIDILRKEWKWNGLIMSDWFALHSHALLTCDLEMPGPSMYRSPDVVKGLLLQGELSEGDIDGRVTKVLELLDKVKPLGFTSTPSDEQEQSVVDSAREDSIRTIAAEGAVLLRNEGGILPLDLAAGRIKKIALIGKPWKEPVQSGGGSANLTPQLAKPAIDSLQEALDALPEGAGKDIELAYHFGCEIHNFPIQPKGERRIPGGVRLEWFQGSHAPRPGEDHRIPLATEHRLVPNIGNADSKPAGLELNDFSLRATFNLVSETSGNHKLALTALGDVHALVHRQDSETILDWKYKGAGDFFLYNLDEFHFAREEGVSIQSGETITVTLLYSPAYIDDAVLARQKVCAFRCGFDEEIDGEGCLDEAASLAGSCDVAILISAVGKDWESEGYDRPHLRLPRLQTQLIERVAQRQEKIILLNVSGAAVDMPFAESVAAIVQAWYGGQEAGAALVDILLGRGRAPASGRLCTTWPVSMIDQPAGKYAEHFPGKDLTGRGHPDVQYAEGRLVGYKWYEAKKITPAYYFGFGLGGYTTFERRFVQVGKSLQKGGTVDIEVEVINMGMRSGKDVVQVYVAPPPDLIRGDLPHKELAAFSCVHVDAGESTMVHLSLEEEAFSHWSSTSGSWHVQPGTYRVILASSADPNDEIAHRHVVVEKEWTWSGLGRVLM